jgi:hypothetical protein
VVIDVYNNPISTITVGGVGSVLAATGGAAPLSPVWIVLGSFALFSVGLAVTRIAPKTQA